MKSIARNFLILFIALPLAPGFGPCRLQAASDEEIRQYQALVQKYNSHRDAGRFQEAEADARQMLDLTARRSFANLPRLSGMGLTFLALADVGQGRYAEAEKNAVEALHVWENTDGPGKDAAVASALNHLANIYARQARYAEAEPFYQRALNVQLKLTGPNDPEVATTLSNLAVLYVSEGKYEQAEPLTKRALETRERVYGSDHVDVAASLKNLANLYNFQRRNAEAEVLYQRALAIERKLLGGKHPDVALTLNNLGNLYAQRSQYAQAAAHLEEALAIREQVLGPNHPDVVQNLHDLAWLHYTFDRYAEADKLNVCALEIQKQVYGDNHPTLAKTLDLQGSIYSAQGRFPEAIDVYQQSLSIYEKALGPNHPSVADTLQYLSHLYSVREDYEKAKTYFDRAIKIMAGRQVALEVYFHCHRGRAVAEWHMGDKPAAVADLRGALETFELERSQAGGTEKERADFLDEYSNAFEEMFAWQLELGHLDEAFAAAEECRARTLIDQLNVQGTDLLAGLPAAEAKRLKDRDTAARALVASLGQQLDLLPDRQDFDAAQKKAEETRLSARLTAARQEQIEAYRAIRNASPAYQSMVTQDFKPVELSALADWVKQQHALLLQYFLGDEGGYLFVLAVDREPQLVKLEISKDQLADFGAEENATVGADHRYAGDGKKHHENLAAGPLTTEQMQLALRINGIDISQRISTGERDDGVTARLAALWKLLIPADQRAALQAGKYDRLIVIPDGVLVNFPLEALVVEAGDNPAYLLDRGPPIVECPSATLIYNLAHREQPAKGSKSKPGVLTVGNPNYPTSPKPSGAGSRSNPAANRSASEVLATFKPAARYAARGNLQPLPHSGTEVSWVAEAFTKRGLAASKLLRAEATEASLRSRVAGQEIVHLACHGLVDNEQGNFFGALALTPGAKVGNNPSDDGFLTLPEIYELNLKGCELSILSACQTNFGPQQRGEGVWALSRGFLVAGSRRVVASNWLVDDEAAASLIYFFCAGVAQQAASIKSDSASVDYAKALHDAKLWVRRQTKWQHPYYWATFTLIGPN